MSNKILNKILSHSKKTKTVIGVRKYNDGDDLYVGYIVDYNDTLIVLQHISKLGLEDGLIIEKIENIESFETEEKYLRAYQLLFANANKIKNQTVKNIKLPVKGKNWQFELLKNNFHQGKIVSVELNDQETIVQGFVIDFDEIHLYFNPISNIGEDEGKNIYKLSDITAFSVDRVESRKREAFYTLTKK